MFYSHTGRYGPRPPPPGGLHGSRLPPFPQEIGNFTRFATFSEYSRTTSLNSTSFPLRQEKGEPYVTSPISEDGDSTVAGSRAESPSSVFRIESVATSSAPTPRQLTPVDSLLEAEDCPTPRAGSPFDPIDREYASFSEVDDLLGALDASSRLAKEYDQLEAVDDLLEPLHSPKKFYSSFELSGEGESRQKHEYLSRAPPREQALIISSNSAFSLPGSYCSSYSTPFTSINTVYYSAEDHLNRSDLGISLEEDMEKEEEPPRPSKDVTTSRVITETVNMLTMGVITPPPGPRPLSPTDTITITDAFGQPEGTSHQEVSLDLENPSEEEEELEEFSRSQAVRRSILPGQRRHPTVLSHPDDGVVHPRVVDQADDDDWEHAGSEEYSYPIMRPRLADEERLAHSRQDIFDATSEEGFSYTTADEGYGDRFQSPVSDIPELEYDGNKTPTPQGSEKSFPRVTVAASSLEKLEDRDFPKVTVPEKLTRSEEIIYAEVSKEKPAEKVEQNDKATQKGRTPVEPSPSYILEETTTEERVEETTETFLENRDYRNFKTRSPLHPNRPHTVYSDYHSVPIVRREPYGGRVLKMVTEMGSATIGGISPALSANAAKSFLEATDKEKKELQGLNDRLGNYIDRVKRLEEQNRKLVADLDELRGKWGKDTSEIKIKYSESLSTARKDIDDSARRKAEIDVKAARLRDDLAEYRSRYEDVQHRRESDREKISQWTNAIADAQSELEMLRARWKQLTDEEKRLNTDNARIWEELQKARNDLDEETVGRIDFQNQVQTLMEELEFLRRVHEQEVKELQALLAQAPADTREFFKNELALAIRDIKDEYDYIAKQGKQDMESWYKLKVSEVQGSANRAAVESNYQREEVKRMRDNIGDLRGKLGDLENKNALLEKEVQNLNYQLTDDQRQYEAALNDRDATLRRMREECQTLVAELQGLLDTKQMLDAEIAIYRKMLEGEESRVGLRQMVEQVVKTHSLQQQEDTDSTRSVRGEVSTKTTFQRSAKGNVTIAECDPNGKFITLENTHRTKEENLGEHKLKRKLDGNRREIVYTIPANTVLKPGKSMKIYARDQGGIHSPPDSLVFEGENTWGIGANVVTSLLNKEGDERATHTQKTIQTGQ